MKITKIVSFHEHFSLYINYGVKMRLFHLIFVHCAEPHEYFTCCSLYQLCEPFSKCNQPSFGFFFQLSSIRGIYDTTSHGGMKKCAENCMQSKIQNLPRFFSSWLEISSYCKNSSRTKISAKLSLDFLYFKIILGIAKKSLGIQIMVLWS